MNIFSGLFLCGRSQYLTEEVVRPLLQSCLLWTSKCFLEFVYLSFKSLKFHMHAGAPVHEEIQVPYLGQRPWEIAKFLLNNYFILFFDFELACKCLLCFRPTLKMKLGRNMCTRNLK